MYGSSGALPLGNERIISDVARFFYIYVVFVFIFVPCEESNDTQQFFNCLSGCKYNELINLTRMIKIITNCGSLLGFADVKQYFTEKSRTADGCVDREKLALSKLERMHEEFTKIECMSDRQGSYPTRQ